MKRMVVGLAVASFLLLSATDAWAKHKGRKGRRHGGSYAAAGYGGCGGCAPACEYREEVRTVQRCVPVWENREVTETVYVPKYSTETRTVNYCVCEWQNREVQ